MIRIHRLLAIVTMLDDYLRSELFTYDPTSSIWD